MAADAELLRTTAAALAAGVELREVNRAIDEGILPEEFLRVGDARYVAPAGCLFIAFYFESADQLTAKERRLVIRLAGPRFRNWTRKTESESSTEDWTFKHKFLAVDFAPFVKTVGDRLEKLAEADKLVSSSPDILSGTPVVKGTRIPVHDVAASAEAGLSKKRILAAYPSLNSDKIDLAVLYAKANPARGRPRGTAALPPGAIILADRRTPRRGKANEVPRR